MSRWKWVGALAILGCAVSGCTVLLVVGWYWALTPQKAPPTPATEDERLTIDFEDLPEHEKAAFEKLLSIAVARAVNQAWKDLDITDPVEVKLFQQIDDLLPEDIPEVEAMALIYVVKPGPNEGKPRERTVGQVGQSWLEYRCATADVPRPFAILAVVPMRGGPARTTFATYDDEAGWRARE